MNRKAFIISVLTVYVQYYDYHLYGFLAAKIAPHFFPKESNIIQLLNTYSILAIAMIAKPTGSIILGKIGDRMGRPTSFRLSLIGTAIASLALFITPSFSKIGYAAIAILLLARMLISACVTSGSDGVRLFIYENIDRKRQCYGIGITSLFTQAGTLMAAVVALVVTFDFMPDYVWKFAFLLGSLLAFTVLFLMSKVHIEDESLAEMNRTKEHESVEEFRNLSLGRIIRTNLRLFVICIFLAGALGSTNQFILIFFGTYNFEILGTIGRSEMKILIAAAIVMYMFFSVVSGIVADRFGRHKVLVLGTLSCIIITILQARALADGHISKCLYLLTTTSLPFMTMPSAAIYKEAIPIAIRYRLFSLSHALGSIFISAPTAYISTFLYHKTNISWMPFCYFITALIMIYLTSTVLEKRRS